MRIAALEHQLRHAKARMQQIVVDFLESAISMRRL
jgi:hypothetical protein